MAQLRFGILTIQNLPWATLVEHWKHIESLGFDSVWVADHFTNPYKVDDDWFDAWTLLPALATKTSTIRIGALVTSIIYRNPAVLARQALTLDHVSGGRLVLGIGATSERDPSHAMTGVENWRPAERVDRYREMIEIVDRMLRQRSTSYRGRYYQVSDALMHPPPVQEPRPPLTIAAAGRRTLEIAARYADTWNSYGAFGMSSADALAATRDRSETLDEYCAAIGRDPGAITRSFLAGLSGDTPCASLAAFHDFVGRFREIGITEFIFFYDYPLVGPGKWMNREMLERVALEAIPALRSNETL